MKIALLVHDYHRAGGHSRYVAELASRWAREHEVHVFSNTVSNTAREDQGIAFHHVPANRANALTLIYTFRQNATRLLSRLRFDVVHDQGLCISRPNVLTAHIVNREWARARPEAPLKEKAFGAISGWAEQLQYSRAGNAQVIAVSNLVRQGLRHAYGFRGNISVIHHGVDVQKFSPERHSPQLRNELGVEPGAPLYLFVGDFRKGAEAAIRALESGHLLCVGGTPPAPYQALARALGRLQRVHFRPSTTAVETYYAGADVLLLPTPYDAFGMVVLEGMAAGLPCVVSDNAGASELIEHGVNGFIWTRESNLADLMQQAARSSVGVAARATALEHTWGRVADETMQVYRRAAAAPKLLAFATQGLAGHQAGHQAGNDEQRLRTLLTNHPAHWFPFRKQAAWSLFVELIKSRYELVCMEGTGIAGGLPLLAARLVTRQRYLVSSGDAVGPFVSQKQPWLGPLFGLYERMLCRFASGFVGWTPYLTGRALTFGVPRAATAAGWAPHSSRSSARAQTRQQLGIPQDALVIGIAGSLTWTPSVRYCYGLELVKAAALIERPGVRFLIVGDGTGLMELKKLAGPSVHFTGRVPREQLPDYFAAMDLASLPQSCDGVGSFRYSTKLSEYLAAGLPIVTGQIPAAYDLDEGWLWRLPGNAPWDARYIHALAKLLETLTPEAVLAHRNQIPQALPLFDRDRQIRRVTQLIDDILDQPCA